MAQGADHSMLIVHDHLSAELLLRLPPPFVCQRHRQCAQCSITAFGSKCGVQLGNHSGCPGANHQTVQQVPAVQACQAELLHDVLDLIHIAVHIKRNPPVLGHFCFGHLLTVEPAEAPLNFISFFLLHLLALPGLFPLLLTLLFLLFSLLLLRLAAFRFTALKHVLHQVAQLLVGGGWGHAHASWQWTTQCFGLDCLPVHATKPCRVDAVQRAQGAPTFCALALLLHRGPQLDVQRVGSQIREGLCFLGCSKGAVGRLGFLGWIGWVLSHNRQDLVSLGGVDMRGTQQTQGACRSGADDAAALPSGVLKGLEPATAILAQTAHAVRVLGQ
mmetsp:Transcript_10347/g.28248  ORF Transcript_10347/g.28248 Transcript_10347/m.28248 type:complete len:330 (+) Transcript_10347:3101-4090(+)